MNGKKVLPEKFIKRGMAVLVIVTILAAAVFSRGFGTRAVFDPDTATTYQVFSSRTAVEDSVLFIGTYIIHKDALNDQLYEKAKDSASSSGQSDVYYKSELSDGQWFNVGDVENGVKGISIEGNPESIDTINPLYVTYYVGSDGILKDAKTLAALNPFDIPDPYDLSTMEELEPIRNQYTMSQSATSISQDDFLDGKGSMDSGNIRTDVYYYQILSTFFTLDLRDEQTNQWDEKLRSLNDSYIALKAAGKEDEAALVFGLMEKVDATRRAIVMERLSELDENLLNTLYNLASGSYYTPYGAFKDSSTETNAGSQPEYTRELEDSLKHNFTGINSASALINTLLGRLGFAGFSNGWWTVLDKYEDTKKERAEEVNKEDDDYEYDDKTPAIYPFNVDSALLDAIGTAMGNCSESYTEHLSKALVDTDDILGHSIYEYSSEIINQTSGTAVSGPIDYLKYATNIRDNVIGDKDGELGLLKSSLINLASDKYMQSATAGVNAGYAALTSEGAKTTSLEDQKAFEEADRSTLQYLIESRRQRETAADCLEFVNERIAWSENLLNQIVNDDYQTYSTSSVQAHIVWLKEEAQKIIDSDESLKSKLDDLQEKKEELQEKRDQCLDNNDLAGAAALDAKIAAVDNDIAIETANVAKKADMDSASNNTDQAGAGTGGDGAGSTGEADTGDGTGAGGGTGDGASQGAGGATSVQDNKSPEDKVLEKLTEKVNADPNADIKGAAGALADIGEVKLLDDLINNLKNSNAKQSTLDDLNAAKNKANTTKENMEKALAGAGDGTGAGTGDGTETGTGDGSAGKKLIDPGLPLNDKIKDSSSNKLIDSPEADLSGDIEILSAGGTSADFNAIIDKAKEIAAPQETIDKLQDARNELLEKEAEDSAASDDAGAASSKDESAGVLGGGSATDPAASLTDGLIDKALDKLADNADADLSGIAEALAGLGAEEALDALLEKAAASGASANTLAGIKAAKDSLKEGKTSLDEAALLAYIEETMGKSLDEMNDDELAIAAAVASRLSRMGIEPAKAVTKTIMSKLVSSDNKYIYRQYSNDKTTEYVAMDTISKCTAFRYFYDDSKSTATMTKGAIVYIFNRGSDEMHKQDMASDPEIMTNKIVYSSTVYIDENDAQNYFDCCAEYVYDSDYSICLNSTKQTKVDELTAEIEEYFKD